MRYTPSDCFETFPFPLGYEPGRQPDPGSPIPDPLDTIGELYHEHRRQIMLARQEGLTKTYNRFHDPKEKSADIAELRRLHVEMDSAVAAAYGWADLELGHGFHETKQGLRYTISEAARREVLDRLLRLNHERYAEEVAAGLHDKKSGSGKRDPGSGKSGRTKGASKGGSGAAGLVDPASPVADPQLTLDLGDLGTEAARQHAPGSRTPDPGMQPPGSRTPDPTTIDSLPLQGQDARYTRLKELLERRGFLSNGDAQAALGVSAEEARALLRCLVDEGLADVEGERRGTRYVWRGGA